jgi:hypothetical protein
MTGKIFIPPRRRNLNLQITHLIKDNNNNNNNLVPSDWPLKSQIMGES